MPTTNNRPLKIVEFNANGSGRQAYGVRKQSQNFEIDVALFSETSQTTDEVLHTKL
jgi:hypothetical protein